MMGGNEMQIRAAAGVHHAQPVRLTQGINSVDSAPEAGRLDVVDEVNFSKEAQMISQTRGAGEVRADRVAEVRSEIAAGTYETRERLEIAVDRLLDHLV